MRRLDHLPGANGRALIGSLGPYTRDRNAFLRDALRRHGDVCRVRFPLRDAVLIGHPDDAARYLHDTSGAYQKLGFRLPLRNLVGGVAFQEGERFRDKRGAMVTMFAGDGLAGAFARVAETVEARLDAEIAAGARGDDIVDLQQVLARVLLPGLLAALFTDPLPAAQVRTIDQGVRLATATFGFLRFTSGPPNLLRGPQRLSPTAFPRLYRMVSALVRARRDSATQHDDVLGSLLALRGRDGAALGDQAVTNELALLLFASYGATTAALTHTLARVLGNPEAAARLAAEYTAIRPAGHSLAEVRRLRWARACFEEALRLQGSAPLIRIAAADSAVRGYAIPEGAPLVFPLAVIHRDPRWWRDPDTFDPSRFHDPSASGPRPALAYLPFGAGPHRCLAAQLAYALGQYLVPELLRRYEPALLPGWTLTEVPGLAPGIAGGLPVRITTKCVR
ncbi:cytochrome P450 [Nocardia goodfellowii]